MKKGKGNKNGNRTRKHATRSQGRFLHSALSRAVVEQEKNKLLERFILIPTESKVPLLLLTVGLYLKAQLTPNSLVILKALLQVPLLIELAILRLQVGEQYFWTRLVNYHLAPKLDYLEF